MNRVQEERANRKKKTIYSYFLNEFYEYLSVIAPLQFGVVMT